MQLPTIQQQILTNDMLQNKYGDIRVEEQMLAINSLLAKVRHERMPIFDAPKLTLAYLSFYSPF
jgi:hypothetical protein